MNEKNPRFVMFIEEDPAIQAAAQAAIEALPTAPVMVRCSDLRSALELTGARPYDAVIVGAAEDEAADTVQGQVARLRLALPPSTKFLAFLGKTPGAARDLGVDAVVKKPSYKDLANAVLRLLPKRLVLFIEDRDSGGRLPMGDNAEPAILSMVKHSHVARLGTADALKYLKDLEIYDLVVLALDAGTDPALVLQKIAEVRGADKQIPIVLFGPEAESGDLCLTVGRYEYGGLAMSIRTLLDRR